jgi:pre-rRNA-processing protein TSR3
MTTFILRHRRENLKKCSLTGLETHPALKFYTYPVDTLPDCSKCLLLKVGAPPLTSADADRDLFLIDGTWRLAQIMEKQLPWKLEARSLPPGYKTAYPRRQTDCPDPHAGLSSLEALYVAHIILGRSTEHFFDRYHWKDLFIKINSTNFESGHNSALQ